MSVRYYILANVERNSRNCPEIPTTFVRAQGLVPIYLLPFRDNMHDDIGQLAYKRGAINRRLLWRR